MWCVLVPRVLLHQLHGVPLLQVEHDAPRSLDEISVRVGSIVAGKQGLVQGVVADVDHVLGENVLWLAEGELPVEDPLDHPHTDCVFSAAAQRHPEEATCLVEDITNLEQRHYNRYTFPSEDLTERSLPASLILLSPSVW